MTAYYNEIDPYAAEWLRQLIALDLIAPGDVDERSIADVRPDDLRGYQQCHFFAGIGGWSYALNLAGWPNDRPVWTGSCPCQPFSAAGQGKAADDERHLWPALMALIGKCRPPTIFGEQVEAAIGWGWLDLVFNDLEAAGYACGASVLPACSLGTPHIRQRLWWVADSKSKHGRLSECSVGPPDIESPGRGKTVPMAYSRDGRRRAGLRHVCEPARQSDIGRRGATGGLADPDGGDASAEGLQRSRQHGQQQDNRSPGDMGNPESRGRGKRRDAPAADYWQDLEWLPCSDGKARPVKRGISPLSDGLPRGMVRGGDPGAPIDPNASAEARPMRLRGYGNAIVPQLAAEFIRAFNGS